MTKTRLEQTEAIAAASPLSQCYKNPTTDGVGCRVGLIIKRLLFCDVILNAIGHVGIIINIVRVPSFPHRKPLLGETIRRFLNVKYNKIG